MVTINITHNIPQVIREYEVMSRVTLPRELEDSAEQAGLVLENSIRKYIPGRRLAPGQKEPSTGRLHASFGHARPEFTTNPEFNPDEAYFKIRKRGRRIQVIIGTTVPYAEPMNNGFTMKETRRVFFPDSGVFRMVSPFYFSGYHFIEKGLAEATSIVQGVFLSGVERAIGIKRFRAIAQKRDIRGLWTK